MNEITLPREIRQLFRNTLDQLERVCTPEVSRFTRMAANEAEKSYQNLKPFTQRFQGVYYKTEQARRIVEAARGKLAPIGATLALTNFNLVQAPADPTPKIMVAREPERESGAGNFWTNLEETVSKALDASGSEQTAGVNKLVHRSDMIHTPDFSTVKWGTKTFTFTKRQAACVCLMWEPFEQQIPFLQQNYILVNAADKYRERTRLDGEELIRLEYCSRFRDVFKNHDAWGTMIQKRGKNLFGLVAPKD